MRRLLWLALLVCLAALPSWARERAYGWCFAGGTRVYVSNVASAFPAPSFAPSYWQQSYPNCTITVYLTGTTTLATIYSDNSSTPLANPFTANSNGYWEFYASVGRYDVRMSGGGLASPFTLGDIQLCDVATEICSIGGGGGGVTPHNLLSNTHPDTLPYSPPIFGDLIQGNSSGLWARLQGNTSTTPKWLKSLGSGLVTLTQDWVIVGNACSAGQFANTLNPDLTLTCSTPSFTNNVTVMSNAATIGTRPTINFTDGGNLTWTITDDAVNNRINITQAVTGGGTGCTVTNVAGQVLYDSGAGCGENNTFIGGTPNSNVWQIQKGGQFYFQNPDANFPASNYINIGSQPLQWQDLRHSTYGFGSQWTIDSGQNPSPVGTQGFQIIGRPGYDNQTNYTLEADFTDNVGVTGNNMTAIKAQVTSSGTPAVEIGVDSHITAAGSLFNTNYRASGSKSDGQSGGAYHSWAQINESGKSWFQDLVIQPEASTLPDGLAATVMSQVTCDSTQRGRVHYVNSGTGIADIPEICVKSAADTYSWAAFSGSYPNIPGVSPAYVTLTDAAPITWAIASNYIRNAVVVLNHATATRALNVTGMVNGGVYNFETIQDSTGGAALTLGTGCTWVVNNVPTTTLSLTTTASAVQGFSWIYDGSSCFVDTTAGGGGGGSTGFAYLGTWSSATTYATNNIVSYNGSSYIALSSNTNVTPGSDGGVTWAVLAAAGAQGPAGTNGVDGTNGTNGAPGAPGYSPNQILSGCGVAYTSGLSFSVSPCSYIIQGVTYGSALSTVTLSAADPSQDRIDVIAVNTSNTVVVLPGTPSTPPAPPSVDISSQLQLTFVYVAAGATTPSNITTTDIYHNNTEWTCASTANFNCASTSNPHAGTLDIEATTATTGNNARLTIPAGTVDISQSNNLVFWIRSKATWASTRSLTLQWYNGTTAKCTPVSLANGNFGFSSSNTTAYQQIVIPTTVFSCAGIPVTQLRFTVAGSGTTIGFYLDDIILQGGLPQATGSNAMVWRGAWSNLAAYQINDTVTYNNLTYTAIQTNTNLTPSTAPLSWSPHSFGVPGASGNLQYNCGTNLLCALNTSITGSVITFPDEIKALKFTSTDTVNNTAVTFTTGSGGDSTCPAPLAGTSYLCTQSSAVYVSQNGGAYAAIATGGGTVTNSGTLTSGQLIVGAGTTVVTTGNLSGAVTTSGSTATTLAARYTVRDCEIVVGDPGAASSVLADDNDTPAVCGNDYGADYTITAVACWANAGSPTVTPILTGGSGTSILTGALTCGTASWAAGTVNGTPTVHAFNSDGATCASTPCTVDANITTAGGTAKYLVIRIKRVIAAP